jgi:alpha-galactosidase
MKLTPTRVVATIGASTFTTTAVGGQLPLGPLGVELGEKARGAGWSWSVANRDDQPVAVRSVALVYRVDDVAGALRMFRHGYQSWSPSSVATFGRDRDPSTRDGSIEFMQALHHADQHEVSGEELRSEWVTVLADDTGRPVLVGFDGGHDHDGTLRLRRRRSELGAGEIELWIEAFLGDAVLAPGERRALHDIVIDETGDDPSASMGRWATDVGRRHRARVAAPYQVGWCSWYHYFHDVTEADLRHNLTLAGDWPFDVFQLDDGYQAAIGDWLETNDEFPSSLDIIADSIATAGFQPGLWIAPFLAAPNSRVATEHPDWLAHVADESDKPLYGCYNPPWGGGHHGFMYTLDTTHPEVVEHLERVAAALVGAGFGYLKLDFTYAPSFDGRWTDPSRTPAQRVRAGYDAIRRGAGDDAFLLGCGVPLANVVGVVDANRIGQDVAPRWSLDASAEVVPGYLETQPSTQNAYVNTLTRSFMHRRLWLNDPDCIMLRTDETELTADAARTWSHAVGVSGGLALVSDDLALLGDSARRLLDDTLEIGRRSDRAAAAGQPATCPDLLDQARPTTLSAAGYALVTDPISASSDLDGPG